MRSAYRTGVLSLLALGLLLAPAAAAEKKADKPKDLIVGKWTPDDEKAKGKVIIEFTKDGKILVKRTEDGKTEEGSGTYKFTADDRMDVEIDFKDGKTKKDTVTVKVTKDELTTTDSKDKKETFKRVK